MNTIFPENSRGIERLRATDAGFRELCDHLELLMTEMSRQFGTVDQATTDLIASFDDVRRDIERHLTRNSARKAGAHKHEETERNL